MREIVLWHRLANGRYETLVQSATASLGLLYKFELATKVTVDRREGNHLLDRHQPTKPPK